MSDRERFTEVPMKRRSVVTDVALAAGEMLLVMAIGAAFMLMFVKAAHGAPPPHTICQPAVCECPNDNGPVTLTCPQCPACDPVVRPELECPPPVVTVTCPQCPQLRGVLSHCTRCKSVHGEFLCRGCEVSVEP
jgi:hypothetical protein